MVRKHVWFSEEANKTWCTFEGIVCLPKYHPWINKDPLDPQFQIEGFTVIKCTCEEGTHLCIEKNLKVDPFKKINEKNEIKNLRKQLKILAQKIIECILFII